MTPRIRAFRAEDAEYIIDNIREDDRKELAAIGLSASDGIRMSVENSTYLYTGLDRDNNPAFVLGTAVTPSGAMIWLLGTDAIDREPKTFLLNSRPVLDLMFEITGVKTIYNYVWKGNKVHIKWLKWLGFHLHEHEEGPLKDFIFFYMTKE